MHSTCLPKASETKAMRGNLKMRQPSEVPSGFCSAPGLVGSSSATHRMCCEYTINHPTGTVFVSRREVLSVSLAAFFLSCARGTAAL